MLSSEWTLESFQTFSHTWTIIGFHTRDMGLMMSQAIIVELSIIWKMSEKKVQFWTDLGFANEELLLVSIT